MIKQFNYVTNIEDIAHKNITNFMEAFMCIPNKMRSNVTVRTVKGKRSSFDIDDLVPELNKGLKAKLKNDISMLNEDLDILKLCFVFEKKAKHVVQTNNKRRRITVNYNTTKRKNNRKLANRSIVTEANIKYCAAPNDTDIECRVNAFINYPYGVSDLHSVFVEHLRSLRHLVKLCYCTNRKYKCTENNVGFFEYILFGGVDPEDLKVQLGFGIQINNITFKLTIVDDISLFSFDM